MCQTGTRPRNSILSLLQWSLLQSAISHLVSQDLKSDSFDIWMLNFKINAHGFQMSSTSQVNDWEPGIFWRQRVEGGWGRGGVPHIAPVLSLSSTVHYWGKQWINPRYKLPSARYHNLESDQSKSSNLRFPNSLRTQVATGSSVENVDINRICKVGLRDTIFGKFLNVF